MNQPRSLYSLSATAPAEPSARYLRGMFLDEAAVHLAAVEAAFQTLGCAADGPVLVRAAAEMLHHLHTLKGAAGSVGLDQVGDAAHELEELAAEIHDQRLSPTIGVLEQLDEALGTLGALLDGARDGATPGPSGGADVDLGPGDDAATSGLPASVTAPETQTAAVARRLRTGSADLEAVQEGVGDLVILRTRIERRLREFEGAVRDLNHTRASLREAVRGSGAPDDEGAPADGRVWLDRMGELEHALGDAGIHLERATRALGGEVETLRRLTGKMDNDLRRARKVPLDHAFARLPHTVRELEHSTGREADLFMRGGEIEVDKTLAEQMAEALLHLVRNALVHGIETAAERRAAGKSARGRIEVTAREEGDFVFVTFADDGRGLDRQEIRRALIRRGRLPETAPGRGQDDLPEDVLVRAIFEAGFSSRAVADKLAGRGLGLNIVKRAAVRMGGDVTVEDSPGRGTRFVISAPNQGAITTAVLFKVGGQVYALPAAHVTKASSLAGLADAADQHDGTVPVLCLQTLFGAESAPGMGKAALHLHHGGQSFVLTCDKIIGPRTIVVRPLGPILAGLPLFSGVTVSGSGKAQLVLDVAALCETAQAAHAGDPVLPSPTASARVAPRVLIVDDSRLQRETTARTLLGAGLCPVLAEDGIEAWEMLTERRFDALVTDLEMPRLDGFDLITRVRQEASLKDLPIVVVSSRTAHAPRQRALTAGADAILPKGPHRKLLLDTLTALLARSAALAHAGESH
jgi:chemosensory pili system protein ChpA (sensor histidine kinase/response regulator)